jgi:hypothetical protein
MPINSALLEQALFASVAASHEAKSEILVRYLHLIGAISKTVCGPGSSSGQQNGDMSTSSGDALVGAAVGGAVAATGLFYAAKKASAGGALPQAAGGTQTQPASWQTSLATWLVRGAENLATIVDAKAEGSSKGDGGSPGVRCLICCSQRLGRPRSMPGTPPKRPAFGSRSQPAPAGTPGPWTGA